MSQLGNFNTPNQANVERLIRNCLGLPDVHISWSWQNCTSAQAVQRLTVAMAYRHQIAHGVNPRPVIHYDYSSQLPAFFGDWRAAPTARFAITSSTSMA